MPVDGFVRTSTRSRIMARHSVTIACVFAALTALVGASPAVAESITVPFTVDVTHVFSLTPEIVTQITGGALREGDHIHGSFVFDPDLPNREADVPNTLGLFGPAGSFGLNLTWASPFAPPTFHTADNGFFGGFEPGADLFSIASDGRSLSDDEAFLLPILSFVDPAGSVLSSAALPRNLAVIRAFPVIEFRMVFSLGEEDGSLFVGKGRLDDTSPVPEPAGVILAGTGLLGLIRRIRKQVSPGAHQPKTRSGHCAQHAWPRTPAIPSLAMIGTMTRAAAGSAHHNPHSVFTKRPPSRIAER
jgi:hypothetical protein